MAQLTEILTSVAHPVLTILKILFFNNS